jgi:hypothetical protein
MGIWEQVNIEGPFTYRGQHWMARKGGNNLKEKRVKQEHGF